MNKRGIRILRNISIGLFLFFTSLLSWLFIYKQEYMLEAPLKFSRDNNFIFNPFILVSLSVFIPLIIIWKFHDSFLEKPTKFLYEVPFYSIIISICLGIAIAVLSMGWFITVSFWTMVTITVASLFIGFYFYFSEISDTFDKIGLIIITILLISQIGFIGVKIIGADSCGPNSGQVDYTCFGDKAIKEDDVKVCLNIEPDYAKARCLTKYALYKKDISYCDFKINPEINERYGIQHSMFEKGQCYKEFFEKIGITSCQAKDGQARANCYLAYYKAREEQCMTISGSGLARECYNNLFSNVTSSPTDICKDEFFNDLKEKCAQDSNYPGNIIRKKMECYDETYLEIMNKEKENEDYATRLKNVCSKVYLGNVIYTNNYDLVSIRQYQII